MWDKIKQWLMLIPGLMLAAIYYLLNKNRSLEQKVAQAEAEKETAKIDQKTDELKKEADQSEANSNKLANDANAAYNEYKRPS